MTSSSSSSSQSSLHDKKHAPGMHNTGESKPKQVVGGLVNKVKDVFNKEKTDEHNYQAGGASHIPPGTASNEARYVNPVHQQQGGGVTGGAAGIAGAAAGGYSGAADRHHYGAPQPGHQQMDNNLDQRRAHGNDVTAHHGNDRHGGGLASNAAGTAGSKLGAVEGATKSAAEKITGRGKDAREHENLHTVANPYQNQQHVQNQPLGSAAAGGQYQGQPLDQQHRPSDSAKLDPLGNANHPQRTGQHEQYPPQNLGNVAMDNRTGNNQF
ncbi:hypothetical protein LPJ57_003643 [Coemansia sp. RSA 486]|nr:hypothetical protein LPJ57_003643 [Coemansia sp. RSA 486]